MKGESSVMLTNMKSLLAIAEERRCAIPAFNVYNAETAAGRHPGGRRGRRLRYPANV